MQATSAQPLYGEFVSSLGCARPEPYARENGTMSDRMPERMPYRMSNKMSDRMSEYTGYLPRWGSQEVKYLSWLHPH